jgi:hypothetical protein
MSPGTLVEHVRLRVGNLPGRQDAAARLCLFLLTFFFIFGWRRGLYADLVLIISIFLCASLIAFGRRTPVPVRALLVGVVPVAALGYAVAVGLFAGAHDFEMIGRLGRAVVNYFGALALVQWYRVTIQSNYWQTLTAHVAASIVVHGAIMLGAYISPELRSVIYFLSRPEQFVNLNAPFLLGLRVPGLTYGLAQTSVVQMWGLLLVPLVVFFRRTSARVFGIGLAFAICTGSVFVSGRTGLVLGAILIPIVLILYYGVNVAKWAKAGSVIGVLSILVWGMSRGAAWNMDGEQLKYTVTQAAEAWRFLTSGESQTSEIVFGSMYFLPKSDLVTLFGAGSMDRSALQITTDVGYVRSIFAMGVFGTFITMIPFVLGLLYGASAYLNSHDSWVRMFGLVCCAIFLSSLFLHGKEVALFTRNQWSIQALLLVLLVTTPWVRDQDRWMPSSVRT